MLPLVIPFLVSRLGLPSWVVKAALGVVAVCLVVISIAVATWQLRVYAEHETQMVATQASNAAKAEVAATVNRASEEIVRAQAEAEAREMNTLAARNAGDAALWAALEDKLSSIPETPDVPPAPVPLMLGVVPPVGDLSPSQPRAAPARVQPVPAAPHLRPHVPGFADLVAADRDADRMLERASAGAP